MPKQLIVISQLLILICLSFEVKAQKPQDVFAIARYKFSHLRDTNAKADFYRENMILYIGKTASMYMSYDKFIQDSLRLVNRNASLQVMNVRSQNQGSKTTFYLFPKTKKIYQNEQMFMNNYLFPIEYPNIKWEIDTGTKVIADLKVQKVKGHWKGRNYTAWFCSDLPFAYGPWKLSGLPGLILEAYDDNREVMFEFAGFEVNRNADMRIAYPSNKLLRVKKQEYDRLRKLFNENPKAYLQSIFGADKMSSVVISPTFSVPKPPNNPIEKDDI